MIATSGTKRATPIKKVSVWGKKHRSAAVRGRALDPLMCNIGETRRFSTRSRQHVKDTTRSVRWFSTDALLQAYLTAPRTTTLRKRSRRTMGGYGQATHPILEYYWTSSKMNEADGFTFKPKIDKPEADIHYI